MTAPLLLFNSLTRATAPFHPIEAGHARVYSCGPTVYSRAHLGNLRAYVFTDTLRRTLNWKGLDVTHVINITDVGHLTSDADAGADKMEAAAAAEQRSIWDIAAHYTALFKADLARLNVRPPTLWATATDHIGEMIDFGAAIADRHCYPLPGGLYFDSTTVPDYGALAGTRPDETVARIDAVQGKRHPADFAIWRATPPGETRQMEWASPWGPGAPGWHLECSVMARKYLGDRFDIHTGGIDHREIHHVNEIAQNQARSGSADTGAAVWMHNNFLVDRGGKMSKSKGGIATLDALADHGVHPLAYRLLCLGAHYRSELEFSADAVLAALTRLRRLVLAVAALRKGDVPDWTRTVREADASRGASLAWQRAVIEEGLGAPARALLDRFDAAVSADLMLPQALPVLEEAATAKAIPADQRLRLVASMDLVLGLGLLSLERADLRVAPATAAIDPEEIERILADRRDARAARDFARSDALRDDLAARGVEVMDGDPLGWDWHPTLA
ncbi:cysteinyl-tRNA synthetase [Sphingomonas jejuensis]|uniref:Cysteine--tRNA ligase n=1 Tax=Sphingomonas jejuensis TaxID=904715 RepID=A0ABX0XHF0_9SPHN|nr:cysteine--tRNA ligase [Sphingomonas jejuensis]NJC32744.1 cysteinyl-tRNA synthetase [Sphingomonas jejuensis]